MQAVAHAYHMQRVGFELATSTQFVISWGYLTTSEEKRYKSLYVFGVYGLKCESDLPKVQEAVASIASFRTSSLVTVDDPFASLLAVDDVNFQSFSLHEKINGYLWHLLEDANVAD